MRAARAHCSVAIDYRVTKILILFITGAPHRVVMRTPLLPFAMALAGTVVAAGCESQLMEPPLVDPSPSPPGPPDPASAPSPPAEDTGFPCDVRAILETNCAPCHAGTMYLASLRTRELWLSYGQIAANLVADEKMPPPTATTQPSPYDRALLIAWVAAGMPAGSCGPLTPPER
jgi:hypothetical protein